MERDETPTPPASEPNPISQHNQSGKPLRLFHINHSSNDQAVFQAACRKGGILFDWHTVDSADKGIYYLQSLMQQSSKCADCWPDLVLLDIAMPKATGFEVLKFIRQTPKLKHLLVIILTGDLQPQNRDEAVKLGANGFILKPHGVEETVRVARQMYEMLKVHNPAEGQEQWKDIG